MRTAALLVAVALTAGCGASPGSPDAPPPEEARFAVIGDFGDGSKQEHAIAAAIRRSAGSEPLAGLVTTGDNVYPSGRPEKFDQAWREPYGWVDGQDLPVVASLGNHDVKGGTEAEQMRLLDMPARWYSRTVGPVQFVVLDSNEVQDPEQLAFLRRALDEPLADGVRHRVLVFHQPAHSCSKHGSSRKVLARWVPLLADGEVDLVLNGHDHNYQRFTDGGITYVVTGGGGANLYALGPCPEGTPRPQAAEAEHHYVELTVSSGGLRVRAVTGDGRELDDTTIAPRAGG